MLSAFQSYGKIPRPRRSHVTHRRVAENPYGERAAGSTRLNRARRDQGHRPVIKGLAAREMGLQHGPGALTHGGERLGVVR